MLRARAPELSREYGTVAYAFITAIQALIPPAPNEVSRNQGDDIWDKLAADSCIKGNIETLIALVHAPGLTLKVPVESPKPGQKFEGEAARDYEIAFEIKAELDRNLKNLSGRTAVEASRQMLRKALKYGSAIAQAPYHDQPVSGKLWIRAVKPKPRYLVGFSVNEFFEIDGFYASETGGFGVQAVPLDKKLPVDTFLWLTFGEEDCDPRGVPIAKDTYNWWYCKRHLIPALLKYLHQWGTPSVVGIAGEPPEAGELYEKDENGNVVTDDDGRPVLRDQVSELLTALQQFEGGTAIAVPYGGDVKSLFAGQGGIDAFEKAVNSIIDRQITLAMFGTARATLESRYGNKGDQQGGKDILDVVVDGLQDLVAGMWNRLFKQWTLINYGPEAAEKYAPICSLRAASEEDFTKVAGAASQLHASGYLADEHYPELDARLGLSIRDMDAWAQERALDRAAKEQSNRDLSRLINPDGTEDPAAAGA